MGAPEKKPVELPIEKDTTGKEYLNLSNLRHGFERQEALLDYLKKKQIPKNPLIRDKYLTYTLKKDATVSYWEDYYSGCDVGVLIGDTWVDDIITIQYTLTNNKSPIYGYISEEFDAVAKGTRIVQGQFALAFKEVGYLNKILENYEGKYSKLKTRRSLTQDEIAEYIKTEKLPKNLNISKEDFTAEEINVMTGGFKSPDKWGEISMPFGGTKIRRDGFDIIVFFGDISEMNRGGTIEFINGCHITSRSLVCEPTGEPIAEMYSFFARALNKHVPKYKFIAKQEMGEAKPEDLAPKTIEPVPSIIRYIPYDKYVSDYKHYEEIHFIRIIELRSPVRDLATGSLIPFGKYAKVKTTRSDVGFSEDIFTSEGTMTSETDMAGEYGIRDSIEETYYRGGKI